MSAADLAVRSQRTTGPAIKESRVSQSHRTSSTLPQQYSVPEKAKRTNSLGWASSACHDCAARKLSCDRRRPFCDVCTRTKGEGKCRGYVQVLNWQDGIASRGKDVGKRLEVKIPPPSQADKDVPKPAVYVFVQENGVGDRSPGPVKKRKATEPAPKQASATAPNPTTRRDADKSNDRLNTPTETSDEKQPGSSPDGNPPPNTTLIRQNRGQRSLGSPRPAMPLYSIPPAVAEFLSFYEWQFSRTTVTWDVKVNPWKSSLPMIHSTVCLMHAVTALSRRHYAHLMKRPEGVEVLAFKDLALVTFNSGMQSTPCEALIATSLSLIGLEYADTGFSNWRIYLQGAYWILEASNGLRRAESNATLRCHIAMLLWWDVTAALLSRQGPVFPQHYLDRILSWSAEYPAEWNYMSLNGCPDKLLVAMYNLALYAPFADQMEDDDIWKLELSISGVMADKSAAKPAEPPDVPVKVEEVDDDGAVLTSPMTPYLYPSVSVEKSRISRDSTPTAGDWSAKLAECWTLSMRLYMYQVFYRHDSVDGTSGESRAEQRWNLARSIISLILEMPIDSNMQKQCLLPVVLAGFELRRRASVTGEDAETLTMRDSVQSYCSRWKILTGLWVFGTAGQLLGRLWGRMDAESRALSEAKTRATASCIPPTLTKPVWWGDIVEEDTRSSLEAGTSSEYLFG